MNDGVWRSPPAGWTVEPRTGHLLRSYDLDGDAYDVAVSIPRDLHQPLPLLIVLDAALHFDAVAGAASALARRAEKTEVGPMIVAGIASGVSWSHDPDRRERDLVPGSRFADRLMEFLQDSLVRDVSQVAAVREGSLSVFGHSFGGLFALSAVLDRRSSIATAVAISPSLWRTPLIHDLSVAEGKRLLIVSGGQEQRINTDLARLLPSSFAGDGQQRVVLDGEDHGSSVFTAIPLGLRFIQSQGRTP